MAINNLEHLQEFHDILADYQASQETVRTLASISFVALLGASAGGRNTIMRKLVERGGYHTVVSDTTRKPRENDGVLEQNGREYWFKTEQQVLDGLRAGQYVEAEVIHEQQVSGINISELEIATNEQKIAINEIDKGGIENIVSLKPDATIIMVLPPSFEQWQRRLEGRGVMDPIEFGRRMRTAAAIYAMVVEKPYFQFVINDDLEFAVDQVEALARGQDSLIDQQAARELAEQLRVQTESLVASLGTR